MRKRFAVGLLALTAGFVVMFGSADRVVAQADKEKDKDKGPLPPKFIFGHDLKVRPGGETDWLKAIKIGIEVFEDDNTKSVIGVSEKSTNAVFPKAEVHEGKCKWMTAHDMSVRKAGEPEFTGTTKKFGIELFRDERSNQLLYVCETGSLAFAPVPGKLVSNQGPKWHHALEPKVRAPEQGDFKNAKQMGLEVFKDENTGDLIYITDIGAIASGKAPAVGPDSKKIAPPKTEYGLVLKVRGANEPDFTDKTKRVGVEVFSDPNASDQLLYITEAGFISTAPKPAAFKPNAKGVAWKGAMTLRARKGGVKDFDNAAKYGIEVFEDNRTGHLIFISETGSIAVLAKQ